jgi:hypothetical protein
LITKPRIVLPFALAPKIVRPSAAAPALVPFSSMSGAAANPSWVVASRLTVSVMFASAAVSAIDCAPPPPIEKLLV